MSPLKKRDTYEESARPQGHLKNWERWMGRRKKVHEKLAKLGRQSGDLIMNIAEEYRNVKEEKLMMTYTRIETRFDRLRGNPNFWNLPTSLRSKDSYGPSEYSVVKTKEEKNEIPETVYVGLPKSVLHEKDVLPRSRSLYETWKSNKYRKEAMQKNSSRIKTIRPHKPEVDELILVGHRIGQAKDISVECEDIDNHDAIFERIVEKPVAKRVAFKLNNTEYYEDSPSLKYHCTLNLIFERNTDSIKSSEKSVLLENTGRVTLRFYWNQYKKLRLFREFARDSAIFYPFCFNKNELLLLPGESTRVPFWFVARKPGSYFEHWELTTLPRMWTEDTRLLIALQGFVFVKDMEARANMITNVLDQRATHTIVQDVIREVLNRCSYYSDTVSVSYEITERELFESSNLYKNVYVWEPKYSYDAQLISELNQFYQDVRQTTDPPEWNFCIADIKRVARNRDALDRHIRSRSQLDSHTKRLQGIIQKLVRPSARPNKQRIKYFLCYTIIKTYLNKAFMELDDIDAKSGKKQSEVKYPKDQKIDLTTVEKFRDRMVFEILDETCVNKTKRIAREGDDRSESRPKSELLKNIDPANVNEVFKSYFCTEARRTSKSGNRSRNAKERSNTLYKFNYTEIDPFVEEVSPNAVAPLAGKSYSSRLLGKKDIANYEEKYITVYVNLRGAVEMLVDTIEANKGRTLVPYRVLWEARKARFGSDGFENENKSGSDYGEKKKKYFVEETSSICDRKEETICSVSSVFSSESLKTDTLPFLLTDQAAQTSATDFEVMEDLQKYSNGEKIFRSEEPADLDIGDRKSSDIFYFLDADEN